jgi:hypothetical protein
LNLGHCLGAPLLGVKLRQQITYSLANRSNCQLGGMTLVIDCLNYQLSPRFYKRISKLRIIDRRFQMNAIEFNKQVEIDANDFNDELSDDALDRLQIAKFYCYALPTAVSS